MRSGDGQSDDRFDDAAADDPASGGAPAGGGAACGDSWSNGAGHDGAAGEPNDDRADDARADDARADGATAGGGEPAGGATDEVDAGQCDAAAGDGHGAGGGCGASWGQLPGSPQQGELDRLVAEVWRAERHVAQAVVLAGRLAGSGVAEAEAGQPLEQVLATACRLTGADRHTLVTAGEALADMPTLRAAFLTGDVSWGQVRGIVRAAGGLSSAKLARLDARLAATVTARGGLATVDPDELVAVAGDAIAELWPPDHAERGERRAIASSFLALQPDFFGGVSSYGQFDAQTAATILAALDAAAPAPHAGQAHHHRGRSASGWSGPSRSRQHAQGLWRLAAEWLAGHPGTPAGDAADVGGSAAGPGAGATGDAPAGGLGDGDGEPDSGGDPLAGVVPVTARKARPELTVTVTLGEATQAVAGTVDLPARGPLPRLTAAAVEALTCSGAVRAVVFDGARPLAATPKVTATDIPAAIRRAVEARDRGCRWPGCQAPLAHTEIHHLIPRRDGGTHHPENLVCLCRCDHVGLHAHGWTLELDGDTGTLSAWRHGRHQWTSQPPARPLSDPTVHPDQATNHDHHGVGRDPPQGRDPPGDEPHTDHHGNPLPF